MCKHAALGHTPPPLSYRERRLEGDLVRDQVERPHGCLVLDRDVELAVKRCMHLDLAQVRPELVWVGDVEPKCGLTAWLQVKLKANREHDRSSG